MSNEDARRTLFVVRMALMMSRLWARGLCVSALLLVILNAAVEPAIPRLQGTGLRLFWSPYLEPTILRYAGYAEHDGGMVGDPANVEFTDVAISLGWKPPARRTSFDLLPLGLSSARHRRTATERLRDLLTKLAPGTASMRNLNNPGVVNYFPIHDSKN